jgi:hypothetical protein
VHHRYFLFSFFRETDLFTVNKCGRDKSCGWVVSGLGVVGDNDWDLVWLDVLPGERSGVL